MPNVVLILSPKILSELDEARGELMRDVYVEKALSLFLKIEKWNTCRMMAAVRGDKNAEKRACQNLERYLRKLDLPLILVDNQVKGKSK